MELCGRLRQNVVQAGGARDVPFRRPDSRHHSPLRWLPGELLFPQAVRSQVLGELIEQSIGIPRELADSRV